MGRTARRNLLIFVLGVVHCASSSSFASRSDAARIACLQKKGLAEQAGKQADEARALSKAAEEKAKLNPNSKDAGKISPSESGGKAPSLSGTDKASTSKDAQGWKEEAKKSDELAMAHGMEAAADCAQADMLGGGSEEEEPSKANGEGKSSGGDSKPAESKPTDSKPSEGKGPTWEKLDDGRYSFKDPETGKEFSAKSWEDAQKYSDAYSKYKENPSPANVKEVFEAVKNIDSKAADGSWDSYARGEKLSDGTYSHEWGKEGGSRTVWQADNASGARAHTFEPDPAPVQTQGGGAAQNDSTAPSKRGAPASIEVTPQWQDPAFPFRRKWIPLANDVSPNRNSGRGFALPTAPGPSSGQVLDLNLCGIDFPCS